MNFPEWRFQIACFVPPTKSKDSSFPNMDGKENNKSLYLKSWNLLMFDIFLLEN